MTTSELNAGDFYLGLFCVGAAFLWSPWFLLGLIVLFAFVVLAEVGS